MGRGAAIRIGFNSECEHEVADRDTAAVGAGRDHVVHIASGDDFHGAEVDDAVDFLFDARAPAAAIGANEVVHGGSVAGACG